MKIHQRMRNGYPELIYNRCLIIEFEKLFLLFKNEMDSPIFYDGVNVGKRRVDFLVEDKIVLEIKAGSQLNDAHLGAGVKLTGGA